MSQTSSSQEEPREALRRRLTVTGDRYWDRYRETLTAHRRVAEAPVELTGGHCLRDGDQGAFVYFTRVDPTLVHDTYSAKWLIFPSEVGQAVGICLDTVTQGLLGALRRARLEFGFTDKPLLDIAGPLLETFHLPNNWQGGSEAWRPGVQARAIRAPGQVAVFHHPKQGPSIPGATAALGLLGELRADVQVPKLNEPKELLPALLESLRLCDVQLFALLWTDSKDGFKVRRRFEMFQKAYAECGGRVAFQRYKDDPAAAGAAAGGEVQMFVERTNPDGAVLSKPLTLTRTADGWRLKRGMI